VISLILLAGSSAALLLYLCELNDRLKAERAAKEFWRKSWYDLIDAHNDVSRRVGSEMDEFRRKLGLLKEEEP